MPRPAWVGFHIVGSQLDNGAITFDEVVPSVGFGTDGSGVDVTFFSSTAGDNMLWDASEEKLIITGTDGQNALEVADGDVSVTDSLTVSGGLIAPLQINAQTGTTYTFVAADAGKLITSSNGSAQTITIPPNSSVAFAIGTQIMVQNIGSANANVRSQGSGVNYPVERLYQTDRWTSLQQQLVSKLLLTLGRLLGCFEQ